MELELGKHLQLPTPSDALGLVALSAPWVMLDPGEADKGFAPQVLFGLGAGYTDVLDKSSLHHL